MYNGKFEVSKGKLIQIFILAILIIIVFCTPAIMDKLAEVVIRLGTRLFGAEKDASTAAHLGYYSDYIKILKIVLCLRLFLDMDMDVQGIQ